MEKFKHYKFSEMEYGDIFECNNGIWCKCKISFKALCLFNPKNSSMENHLQELFLASGVKFIRNIEGIILPTTKPKQETTYGNLKYGDICTFIEGVAVGLYVIKTKEINGYRSFVVQKDKSTDMNVNPGELVNVDNNVPVVMIGNINNIIRNMVIDV